MHTHSLEPWTHQHAFLGARHDRHARRTWFVVALTALMMVVEIVGGTVFGSMALVADGWHMSTHAGALAIAGFAYHFARKHSDDPRFTFGTGKLGELAGFASAVMLALVALLIAYESAQRLLSPVSISFNEAIAIAIIGLAVNVVSALLLREDHDHHHDHEHHDHHHRHGDTNLRAAYLHVLADALTSVLAIVGLLAARFYGWVWMDPAVGIVGAIVIASWSIGLIRSASATLLDMVPDRFACVAGQGKARGKRRPGQRSAHLAPGAGPLRPGRLSGLGPAARACRLQGATEGAVRGFPCHGRGARLQGA